MLLHQVGEGLVRQFLKRRHAVARQLLQLGKSVVVKFDQFTHAPFPGSVSQRKLLPNIGYRPGGGKCRMVAGRNPVARLPLARGAVGYAGIGYSRFDLRL